MGYLPSRHSNFFSLLVLGNFSITVGAYFLRENHTKIPLKTRKVKNTKTRRKMRKWYMRSKITGNNYTKCIRCLERELFFFFSCFLPSFRDFYLFALFSRRKYAPTVIEKLPNKLNKKKIVLFRLLCCLLCPLDTLFGGKAGN